MAFRRDPPTIKLEDLQWEAIGEKEPQHRLLAHIQIGTLSMHLEAREVYEDEEGLQRSYEYDDDLERLHAITDCAFETIIIDGREYFLFAVPYGA
jgi:hypothetical protein